MNNKELLYERRYRLPYVCKVQFPKKKIGKFFQLRLMGFTKVKNFWLGKADSIVVSDAMYKEAW